MSTYLFKYQHKCVYAVCECVLICSLMHVRVILNEINIWISELSKVDSHHYCHSTPFNTLKANRIKGWVRENSLCSSASELGYLTLDFRFKLGVALILSVLLCFIPWEIDWNYGWMPPGSSAWKQHILAFLSLRSHMRQLHNILKNCISFSFDSLPTIYLFLHDSIHYIKHICTEHKYIECVYMCVLYMSGYVYEDSHGKVCTYMCRLEIG